MVNVKCLYTMVWVGVGWDKVVEGVVDSKKLKNFGGMLNIGVCNVAGG